MTINHGTAYERGTQAPQWVREQFSTAVNAANTYTIPVLNATPGETFRALKDSVSQSFGKVAGVVGDGTDFVSGTLSNYMSEDVAKVLASTLTLGATMYLASGMGPILGLGVMALGVAGTFWHTADNIRPGSMVSNTSDFLFSDYVDIYKDWRAGAYSSPSTGASPSPVVT